jgi:hypothetical protein
LVAALACASFLVPAVAAQEERPQITPGERKAPRKKDAGPRALGVLQIAENGKATILPIFILVDGKYYDATDYKADPIPMALDSGIVYEGTRSGNSLGLFTIGGALHSQSSNSPSPWIGTGTWVPTGTEVAKTTHKAEIVPVGIESSDGPPRLTRGPTTATPAPATKDAPASSPPAPPTSSAPNVQAPATTAPTSSEGASSSAGSSSPAAPATPSAGTSSSSPQTPGTPSSSQTAPESKPADAKPTPPSDDSGADATHRPRLRRGVPTAPLPEEEVPGYSKVGPAGTSTANKTGGAKITEATAAKGVIQLVPAVSDASGTELHSYTFDWLKDEESDRRKQMMDLAKQQLSAYVAARAKGKITPKAGAQASSKHASAKKPLDPMFGAVQMITYDLWRANQPILVFTADAQMPLDAGAPPTADSDLPYSITLVTRTDIYGNLKTLYAGITDKYHLDLVPRLELIDAVDADGDGRGELLFRETSDSGMGWIIYRATADKLWKLFDSLNPQ